MNPTCYTHWETSHLPKEAASFGLCKPIWSGLSITQEPYKDPNPYSQKSLETLPELLGGAIQDNLSGNSKTIRNYLEFHNGKRRGRSCSAVG